jgi:RecA-family ATPase
MNLYHNNMSDILKYYDYITIRDVPEITWIIEEVLPNNGLIIVYGSPGSGKTFIVLDMCLHITNKMRWFSNDVSECGIIVYLIGEGIYGIKKRLESWMEYHNKHGCNKLIYFVPINSLLIWEDQNMEKLSKTMKKFMKDAGMNVTMLVVDTLARAATCLDENSSRDMGKFLKSFEKIKDEFSCSILFIHHKGKDESRGMRGSSSLLGAVDTCIDIKKDDNRVIIKIEKQKDGENRTFDTKLIKIKDSLVVCTKEDMVKNKSGTTLEYFTHDKIMTGYEKTKIVWEPDDDITILTHIKLGKSLDKISELIDKPDVSILKRFRRLITKENNNKKYSNELIKIYGVKDNNIIKYIKKHFKKK